eukprot:CFRG6329T1
MAVKTETYDTLVQDLDDAFDGLKICISQLQSTGLDKTTRTRVLSDGHTTLDSSEELLEQLELELKNMSQDGKGVRTMKLRDYQNKLDKLERDLNRAANSQQSDVYHGGYGYHSDEEEESPSSIDDPNRERLLLAQQTLERTNQRLDNSERVAREIEDYGGAVLTELQDQRESIVRMGDMVDDTGANLYRSDRTLRGMLRRNE